MDVFTVVEKAFFVLLRAGLWDQLAEEDLFPLSEGEWNQVIEMAKKQALLGIVFDGVTKLSSENQPPKLLKLQWIVILQKIELQNQYLNQKSVEISDSFLDNGFQNVILKGQGLACYYNKPLHRQSGDIDIYLRTDRKDIISYVNSNYDNIAVSYQHVNFVTSGVEIECHTHCSFLFDPLRNWRLQRKLRKWTEDSFKNLISLPEGKIPVPTVEMNQTYILLHIFTHLFSEGVGLRQVCDYAVFMDNNFDEIKAESYEKDLKELGLFSFAKAVFYIMVNYLGYLPEKVPLNITHTTFGPILFEEILLSGNFGKYDTRVKRRENESYWQKFIRLSARSTSFFFYFPREVMSRPFFKIFHYFWRKLNGYI